MRYLKWCIPAVLLFLLAACGDQSIEEFSHIDQRGEELSLEQLKGTPWLAAFIFTNCTTVCPPMVFNLAEIQDELVADGVEDYRIVAFTVDPQDDTPEKMQAYLDNFPIPDQSKWHLLTGYEQDDIRDWAADNFKMFIKDDPTSDQVIHGTTFYLVDQEGVVTKNYDGYTDVPKDMIRIDLEKLVEQ